MDEDEIRALKNDNQALREALRIVKEERDLYRSQFERLAAEIANEQRLPFGHLLL